MERTEWGDYEEEKDNYSDLSIVFKKDMTFKVSRTVPFLLDTTGRYVIRGRGKLSDIRWSSLIEKYGYDYKGDWLWKCWEDSPGDSVTAIIGAPAHLRRASLAVPFRRHRALQAYGLRARAPERH